MLLSLAAAPQAARDRDASAGVHRTAPSDEVGTRAFSDRLPTIWHAAAFCSSVAFMDGAEWVTTGRRDAAFERARAVEAISVEARFRGLLDRHEVKLRRVAVGMLTDPGRVEDVLQEALIRVYRKLPARFESERQEAGWLYRIVYRCCLDEIRRSRRRPETTRLTEDVAAAPVEGVPESVGVVRALAVLAPPERAVVMLVDLLGFDYESVAAALRIPRGTVAWRLSAARQKLRGALREIGVVADE